MFAPRKTEVVEFSIFDDVFGTFGGIQVVYLGCWGCFLWIIEHQVIYRRRARFRICVSGLYRLCTAVLYSRPYQVFRNADFRLVAGRMPWIRRCCDDYREETSEASIVRNLLLFRFVFLECDRIYLWKVFFTAGRKLVGSINKYTPSVLLFLFL